MWRQMSGTEGEQVSGSTGEDWVQIPSATKIRGEPATACTHQGDPSSNAAATARGRVNQCYTAPPLFSWSILSCTCTVASWCSMPPNAQLSRRVRQLASAACSVVWSRPQAGHSNKLSGGVDWVVAPLQGGLQR